MTQVAPARRLDQRATGLLCSAWSGPGSGAVAPAGSRHNPHTASAFACSQHVEREADRLLRITPHWIDAYAIAVIGQAIIVFCTGLAEAASHRAHAVHALRMLAVRGRIARLASVALL